MGFTSQDDLINQMTTNGKRDNIIYQKTIDVAQVAATWTDLTTMVGIPGADTYAGTSLTYVPTDDTSLGAIYHGGNVANATKHFMNVGATVTAAAGAPWILMCVDQLGYIPVTGADVTGTSQRTITMTALDGAARYAAGVGTRACIVTTAAPTAGGPNLTEFTYKNVGGTQHTCPVTVGNIATPVKGAFTHTGAAATRYGPFIPLAAGDTGISDIETFTFNNGTAYTGSGTLAICLVKPLFVLPIPSSGSFTMTDFVNMLPSMPRIKDGAYLKFFLFNTGATSISAPVTISLDYAYGG